MEEVLRWEGLPPLEGERKRGVVVFTHVRELWTKDALRPESTISTKRAKREFGEGFGVVIVEGGHIVCIAHHRDSEACPGQFKRPRIRKLTSMVVGLARLYNAWLDPRHRGDAHERVNRRRRPWLRPTC